MATSDTLPDSDSDSIIRDLIERNRQWVNKILQRDSEFFKKSAKDPQRPKVLWIGWCIHLARDCFKDKLVKFTNLYPNSADSRVPESVILDCLPGEIFVHRNIANQFRPDDTSALAVLQYAVENLKVKHVIVATIPALVTFDSGSHGCGGADASIEAACGKVHIDKLTSPLFQFLVPLAKLARELGLGEEIDDMSNKLLIEENVRRQVHNIVNSDTIQKRSENVTVHGWIYNLHTGYVEEIYALKGPSIGPY